MNVYEDFISRQKPEGKAKLVKRLLNNHPDVVPKVELWSVQFESGDVVDRFILTDLTARHRAWRDKE